MFGHARTAVKFFVYGILAGVFLAPRSGAETRAEAIDWVTNAVKRVSGGAKN